MVKKGSFIGIIIAIASVPVLYFVYKYFFCKFTRHPGNLPYFWIPEMKSQLFDYISHFPMRDAILLTGPYGTGKSAALSLFGNEIRSSGNFILKLDFSHAKTVSDIIGFATLDCYSSLKLNHRNETSAFNFIVELTKIIPRIVNSTLAITDFLDCIEKHSYLNPILIVQGVNCLKSILPLAVEAGIARISRRNLYNDTVPFIFESGDSSIRLSENSNYFRILEADEIPNAQQNLVGNKYFSFSEFRYILKTSGVNGAIVDSLFQQVKNNIKIDKAMKLVQSKIYEAVWEYKSECTTSIIKNMCKKEKIFATASNVQQISHLINKGLIYVTADYKLTWGNKLIFHALCD